VSEFNEPTITWNLEDIDLSDLVMVVGSWIFAGNNIQDIESEVIDKLKMLVEAEQNRRLTGIAEEDTIH
jgi:hypothetical protein